MDIAQLRPDDWAVFRELRIAALSDAPDAFGSTLEAELRLGEPEWRAKLAARVQLVAREPDGRVLGTVGASRDGDAIDLVSMWVAPVARGRGIGAALVARVIDHAREAGCHRIQLAVTEGNAAAERLYARSGFVRTGMAQPVRPGEPRNELEMVRGV